MGALLLVFAFWEKDPAQCGSDLGPGRYIPGHVALPGPSSGPKPMRNQRAREPVGTFNKEWSQMGGEEVVRKERDMARDCTLGTGQWDTGTFMAS